MRLDILYVRQCKFRRLGIENSRHVCHLEFGGEKSFVVTIAVMSFVLVTFSSFYTRQRRCSNLILQVYIAVDTNPFSIVFVFGLLKVHRKRNLKKQVLNLTLHTFLVLKIFPFTKPMCQCFSIERRILIFPQCRQCFLFTASHSAARVTHEILRYCKKKKLYLLLIFKYLIKMLRY